MVSKLETNEKVEAREAREEGVVREVGVVVITGNYSQLQDTETNYHPSVNCSLSWPPLLSVGF